MFNPAPQPEGGPTGLGLPKRNERHPDAPPPQHRNTAPPGMALVGATRRAHMRLPVRLQALRCVPALAGDPLMRARLARFAAWCRRVLRIAKALWRDDALPRPVRWLLVVGLLPIPGPFDEVMVLIALGVVWCFYRPALRRAIEASRQ